MRSAPISRVYDDVEDFLRKLTPAGLKGFDHIEVIVGTADNPLTVLVVKRGKWSPFPPADYFRHDEFPGFVPAYWRYVRHPPGSISFDLDRAMFEGVGSEEVVQVVLAAIDRGHPRAFERFWIAVVTAVLSAGALQSYLVLTSPILVPTGAPVTGPVLPEFEEVLLKAVGIGLGVFVALTLFVTWVRPPVEIARRGQIRLGRASKFIGGPLVALIVAGIAKRLWG